MHGRRSLARKLAPRLLALSICLSGASGSAVAQEVSPTGWAGVAPPARVSAMPGGARGVRVESPELARAGRVEGRFVLNVGSVHEPFDRDGLVAVLALALDKGGSVILSGADLTTWLAAHDCWLEISSGLESLEFAFSAPLEHYDALLERLVALLVSPSYPESALEQAKEELSVELERRAADPRAAADDLLRRLALGMASPWSRTPTRETIARIGRMDVLGFHRSYVGQSVLTVGIAAGREQGDLIERAGKALARLGRGGKPAQPDDPRFVTPGAIPLWLLDVPDCPMAEVRVATPVPSDETSARALDLWVRALNLRGGDDAALRSAQRRLQGLTFDPFMVRRTLGPFGWIAAGRADSAEAVDACEAAYDALSGHPRRAVPSEPIERARSALAVQRTPRDELAEVTRDVAAGLDANARADALQALSTVQTTDVVKAVHTRLAQRPPVVVVVGPAAQLYAPLRLLGPVAVHSGLAAPRGEPDALALRARMLEALGGAPRWARLIGVRLEGEMRAVGSVRPTRVLWVRDLVRGYSRIEQDDNGVPATIGVTPTGGWSRTMRSVYDLPSGRHDRLVRRERRQLSQVLHELACNPALEVRLGFEGRLEVLADEDTLCWLEVGDDGRPIRLGYDDQSDDPGLFAYSDWRSEQGYLWPANIVQVTDSTLYRCTRFEPVFTLRTTDFERPVR
jgi:predicted Zn-dependent peptidase